jgi:hypothetical protein
MVPVRLGTLSLMYREFCGLAFDEAPGEFDDVRWDKLGIDSSSLVQLISPKTESIGAEHSENADDNPDTDDALRELSQRVRPEIYDALKEGFGDDSMLCASLWRSPTEHDPRYQESLEETLNEVTADKADAFRWICEGMYRLEPFY